MVWSDPPLQGPILSRSRLPPDPPPLPPLNPPRSPPCIRLKASWHRLTHSFLPPWDKRVSKITDSEFELHSALVPTLPQVKLSTNSAFVPFRVFLNSALVETLPLTSPLPSTMLLPSLLNVED